MKGLVPGLVTVALWLSACGGSVCSHAEQGWDHHRDTASACVGDLIPEFDEARCERALPTCTGDELTLIARWTDCYRALPECDRRNPGAYANAIYTCDALVEKGVRPACFTLLP